MKLVYFQACVSGVYVRLTVSLPLNLVHAHRMFYVCMCVCVCVCVKEILEVIQIICTCIICFQVIFCSQIVLLVNLTCVYIHYRISRSSKDFSSNEVNYDIL